MYEVVVEDEFQAAHFLRLYDGSWEKRHGHNFKVAVAFQAKELDTIGVVVDFEVLKPALRKVLSEFDGICLNDHPAFKDDRLNPSTENIAKLIGERLLDSFPAPKAHMVKVTVWETPDAYASYIAQKS